MGVKIKNLLKPFNIFVPIKPNPNLFNILRNEKTPIPPLQTSGIYCIPLIDSQQNHSYYIGVTKRTIKERLKEHHSDIKFGREGTSLSQLNKRENIHIEFEKTYKLANYQNHDLGYQREAIEIFLNSRSINAVEHANISERWRQLLEPSRKRLTYRLEQCNKDGRLKREERISDDGPV